MQRNKEKEEIIKLCIECGQICPADGKHPGSPCQCAFCFHDDWWCTDSPCVDLCEGPVLDCRGPEND